MLHWVVEKKPGLVLLYLLQPLQFSTLHTSLQNTNENEKMFIIFAYDFLKRSLGLYSLLLV